MPIKLERKIESSDYFYEVMLSPFDCSERLKEYLDKYTQVYPLQELVYRITYYSEDNMPLNDSKKREQHSN